MIKTILFTAVVAVEFSGCVGTAKIANDAKSTTVQNAKSTKDVAVQGATDTVNSAKTAVDGAAMAATPSGAVKDMAVDKAVEVADEHTDGKASVVKDLMK